MKTVSIQFVIFLLLLVPLEGVVRLSKLAPEVYRLRSGIEKSAYELSENPLLGYVMKANYRDTNPDLHESFPYTNAHGQRDIERSYKRIPHKRRVLLLGDSVVAGHGIFDLNHTLSRQLEGLFPEQNTEVLNFGIGGYCTRGEVELLRVKGLRYSPDEVILVFVENDVDDRNYQTKNYHFSRPKWAEWLFIHYATFRALAYRANLFQFRGFDTNFEELNRKAIGQDNVRAGLPELQRLATKHGFKTSIVIWPRFDESEVNENSFPTNPDSKKLVVEEVAEDLGIPTFRLSEYFRSDHAKRCGPSADQRPHGCLNLRRLYTIGDGMHPSELGAEVGAHAIFNAVFQEAPRRH